MLLQERAHKLLRRRKSPCSFVVLSSADHCLHRPTVFLYLDSFNNFFCDLLLTCGCTLPHNFVGSPLMPVDHFITTLPGHTTAHVRCTVGLLMQWGWVGVWGATETDELCSEALRLLNHSPAVPYSSSAILYTTSQQYHPPCHTPAVQCVV